jgi:tetratricopeptide (TPR) repeat protein/DNA-binding transcriptional ArsR family regulator
MTRALVTSSKYSPGNMKPEALEALFVGREKTLHDVLARIAASATGRSKHYFLLVGPRGIGKTHFVALLHHRLTTASEYEAARRRLEIAYLNEEEWGVASFLDLLVRILRALASNHEGLDARIEAVYDAHEKDPLLALEVARSLLIEVVGDKTLLVLCENLVDLFEGLGEEGQKRWRAFIQEHRFWTILATAPALFAGVQLQTSPFYGFFTERRLETLDFETAVRLLQKKAELDGRRELAELLGTPTGRARARAIHHLAGGNHRVYVAMSEFLDRESLDDLVTPFLRMVDDLTPYYQDRMRQLAPQQRKLVELLSRHETPAMVKEIARRCLITQQTAAKQLGELARLGFVVSIKSGRATYYELAEPLMRICVEVKDNKTEHLGLFVRFLRGWFTARELRARFHDVCGFAPGERRVDRLHLEVALKEWSELKDEPFLDALTEEGKRCFRSGNFVDAAEVFAQLANERDNERTHLLCAAALCRLGKTEEALLRIERVLDRYPQSHGFAVEHALALSAAGRNQEALVEIDRALSMRPDSGTDRCARGGILMSLGRYEDVLVNEEIALELDPKHAHSFEQQSSALLMLGRAAEAEVAARALLKHKAYAWRAWSNLSRALFQQGKHEEALTGIDRALRLQPKNVSDLCFRGNILDTLLEHERVLENDEKLLSIDPTHYHSLYSKARAMLALGRVEDAERAATDFLEKVPGDHNGTLLAAIAKAGARGIRVGVEYVTASLPMIQPADAAKSEKGDPYALAIMMTMDAMQRGPFAMSQELIAARSALTKPGLDGLLPAALMQLVQTLPGKPLLVAQGWDDAVQVLSTALADLPDCALPLKMLAAAARYSRTRDVADLLDLPLEQRTLLLDAFPEPATDAEPDVAARARKKRGGRATTPLPSPPPRPPRRTSPP